MFALLEPLLILFSLVGAYIWVSSPELTPYSLQLSAGLGLAYLVGKRLSRSRWHHVLPRPQTLETAILVGGVAIAVGGSGGLSSPLLPLFHLLMFVGVLTLSLPANLVKMSGLTLFLWATAPHPLTQDHLISLFSLPLLVPLMVFARVQFEEAQSDRQKLQATTQALAQEEKQALLFVNTFLLPKLEQVQSLLRLRTPENTQMAEQQIKLIAAEADHLRQELNSEPSSV